MVVLVLPDLYFTLLASKCNTLDALFSFYAENLKLVMLLISHEDVVRSGCLNFLILSMVSCIWTKKVAYQVVILQT